MKNYLLRFYVNSKIDNPQITFSKNIIATIFSFLSEDQIKEIAGMAFQNAQDSLIQVLELLNPQEINELEFLTFQDFLRNSKMRTYSSAGLNWFDVFDFKVSEKSILVIASHNLGRHFSQFFYYVMQHHAESYEYEVESYQFIRKSISLTDKQEKDHIILKFRSKEPIPTQID